ncbi:hypothetical protein WMY93_003885 [Mugilogobius chulae]|uniref:Ubiquitin-like domain-containing protein n=1 Tax=Mugilogobius chulae TaxID=88201 RepID=A0AAW0Q8Q4_9GOBI
MSYLALCETEEQFSNLTVQDFKKKVIDKHKLDQDKIRLIFAGRQLNEDRRLLDYGIQNMCTIQIACFLSGGDEGPREGNLGDKDHKNRSMDRLCDFNDPLFKTDK